ncbi:hypothetical protein TUM20984_27000 [Mycobacterium antarcticum]|nr:hypothetical protein TUM20984_27000 [Mycolicibacterium sp. TUM20984]
MTRRTAPNTDVNHGPRNGLRHLIFDNPGGGWFSSVRQIAAGNPCWGASRTGAPEGGAG